MARSSLRHSREIYGIDAAGETPEVHGDTYTEGHRSNALVINTDYADRLPLAGGGLPATLLIDFTGEQLFRAHEVDITYDIGAGDQVIASDLSPGMTDALLADALAFVLSQVAGFSAVVIPPIQGVARAMVVVQIDAGTTLYKLEVSILEASYPHGPTA